MNLRYNHYFKNNAFLNYSGDHAQGFGYCVFGEVVEGMDVVDEEIRHLYGFFYCTFNNLSIENLFEYSINVC